MSHTKSHSHGSIPFSWEDKPGVCKIFKSECSLTIGSLKSLNKNSSSSLSPKSTRYLESSRKIQEIPLPPCRLHPPPQRSLSGKGFRWQEDPFLVAYKECTRNENKNVKLQGKNKKGVGSSLSEKRSKFNFSCRSIISDVRDDCYVKLPHIPVARNRLTLEDQQKHSFNDYETWL